MPSSINRSPLEVAFARCFARWGDVLFPFLLLRLVLRPLGYSGHDARWDWYIGIALAAILNAIQEAVWGTTLHKNLFGLQIRQRGGELPSVFQALLRELHATAYGMACGFPLAIPIAHFIGGLPVLKRHRTAWDRKWHLHVRIEGDTVGDYRGRYLLRIVGAMSVLIQSALALFWAAEYY